MKSHRSFRIGQVRSAARRVIEQLEQRRLLAFAADHVDAAGRPIPLDREPAPLDLEAGLRFAGSEHWSAGAHWAIAMQDAGITPAQFEAMLVESPEKDGAEILAGIGGALGGTSVGAAETLPPAPEIGRNFEGADYAASGFIPPDTMGAVGNNHVVLMINGRFRIYDKWGTQLDNRSLDSFWINKAGVTPTSFSFDPRIQYDAAVDRWYATSVDNAGNNNSFLFAVSNTSDPTGAWTGAKIDSDAGSGNRWADFPQMGYDNDGVYITANMFDIAGGAALPTEVNIIVIRKSGLLAASPSISFTKIEDVIGTTGFAAQPVVYVDSSEAASIYPPAFVSANGNASIAVSGLAGTIGAPTIGGRFTTAVANRNGPPLARQPGGPNTIETGGNRIRSKVDFQNGEYWAVQGVDINGKAGMRMLNISSAVATLQEVNMFANDDFDLYYGSIAVNNDEDVVVGFTYSGPSRAPSAAYIIGDTNAGVTSLITYWGVQRFGSGNYVRLDSSNRNRWGDYSATVLDPVNSSRFWTFQEFVDGTNNWSTQITEIGIGGVVPGGVLPNTLSGAEGQILPFGPTGFANDTALSFDAFMDFAIDADSYFFGADNSVGSTFTINVSNPAGSSVDPVVALYNAETGALLAFDADSGTGDNALLTYAGNPNTRYILAVSGQNGVTGDLEITVDWPSSFAGEDIPLDINGDGTPVFGNISITPSEDSDFYLFTTPANSLGTGTVTFDPDATLAGAMSVFNAAGDKIGGLFVGIADAPIVINLSGLLPSTTYYITVGSNDLNSTGKGDLFVDISTPPAGLPLVWTAPVEGVIVPFGPTGTSPDLAQSFDAFIDAVGETDSFYFGADVPLGSEFTIDVGDFGGVPNPFAAVYRADTGAFVASDLDSGVDDDAQIVFTATFGVRYILVVGDEGTATGDLSINVAYDAPVNPFTGQPIPLDAAGLGSVTIEGGSFGGIPAGGDAFFYRFTVPFGFTGPGAVSVVPGGADAELYVFRPDGTLLGSSRTGGPGATETVLLSGLIDGTEYYATVIPQNYAAGVPTGTVHVAFLPPLGTLPAAWTLSVENQLAAFGPTATGLDTFFGNAAVDFIGDIDTYYFGADNSIGGAMTINVGGLGVVDAVAAVYRADTGVLVAYDDDSGPGFDSLITFAADPGVRYILAVTDFAANLGDIVVTTSWGTPFNGSGLSLNFNGQRTQPIILNPATDQDFYTFTTPAVITGTATIELDALTATLRSSLIVFDGAGTELGADPDTAPGGTATVFLGGLAPLTTYYITVLPTYYDAAGDAELRISVGIPVAAPPSAPDLIAASDTGVSSTDNRTRDDTPTFIGVSQPNALVRIFADAIEVGSGFADGAGAWSITSSPLPDGSFAIRATADIGGGQSAPGAGLAVQIDTAAPTVISSFEFEVRQAVRYAFNESVDPTFALGDVVLLNTDTAVPVPNASLTFTPAGGNAYLISWPILPNGALPNGDYRMSIGLAGVTDVAGNKLALSGSVQDFFVLAGDANRDRIVNVTDLGILATNWQGLGRTFSQGNFSYDLPGAVDVSDLGILASNWQAVTESGAPASATARMSPLPQWVRQMARGGLFSKRGIVDREKQIVLGDA